MFLEFVLLSLTRRVVSDLIAPNTLPDLLRCSFYFYNLKRAGSEGSLALVRRWLASEKGRPFAARAKTAASFRSENAATSLATTSALATSAATDGVVFCHLYYNS